MTDRVWVCRNLVGRWLWVCRKCWAHGTHPGDRLGWELALYNGDHHARHQKEM